MLYQTDKDLGTAAVPGDAMELKVDGGLQPGNNCWRIETATKLQFLIDGEEYFRALRASLLRAQHSIYIIGWDIDSRVLLPRLDESDHLPESLARFLGSLARFKPDLHIYILSWDYAFLFTLEREWLPILPLQWRTHRRVHFKLDNSHPPGASHHQKLVVIDDTVAFIGGIDLARCRWDTAAHTPNDPRRQDADGKPYSPFHDVQIVTEGPVASALAELARMRWQRALRNKPQRSVKLQTGSFKRQGEQFGSVADSPWPAYLKPALEHVKVGIARTEAAFKDYPEQVEIRNFYLDAIAAARKLIFFENQYFSSNAIAQALRDRLITEQGPDVILIAPRRESGWLEENTMGLLRARLYEQLKSNPNITRFHSYSPLLDDGSGLNVHSKLMIVDDEWLTVGSANLSNRSMSLDTECNLIIGAALQGERSDEVRAGIAHVRNRLLAEHLDCEIDEIAELQSRVGLIPAIEILRDKSENHSRRTLTLTDPLPVAENLFITDAMLIDPEIPLKPEHVIANYIPPRDRQSVRSHATKVGIAVIVFALLVLLWRETPLKEFFRIEYLFAFVEKLQNQPLAPLFILVLYVIAGFVFVPVVLLIAATGAVFGPGLGFVYALCGSLLSAATTFWIGSKTGSNAWDKLLNNRVSRLQARLQDQGLLAVAMVRVMPIAPFTAINLIAGAAKIRWRDFMLGTITGMLPGILFTVLFVDRATAALQKPTPLTIATLVFTMAAIVAVSLFLQHWLRYRSSKNLFFAKSGNRRM